MLWASEEFLQRSTSSNLLLHQVALNLRNEPFLEQSPHTIACSSIIGHILLMRTADIRIICFPWGYFSKIRGRAIKQSGSQLDSRRLGNGGWEQANDREASDRGERAIGD